MNNSRCVRKLYFLKEITFSEHEPLKSQLRLGAVVEPVRKLTEFPNRFSFFCLLLAVLAFPAFAEFGAGFSCSADLVADVTDSAEGDFAASATFRADTSPWCVFLNAHFSPDLEFSDTVSFFADDWFVYERIAEHLDFFILWGISGGGTFSSRDDFSVGTGCRAGAGLSAFLLGRHVEFFSQAAWNPYISLGKSDGDFDIRFVPLNFPVSAGVRFWN